jgi:hypothetical protein
VPGKQYPGGTTVYTLPVIFEIEIGGTVTAPVATAVGVEVDVEVQA